MKPIYTTYLTILKNIATQRHEPIQLTPDEQHALVPIAKRHFTAPFLLSCVTDAGALKQLKKQTKSMMLHYHQIAHLTHLLVSLLDSAKVPYFLLKGISLAQYYPFPESRKLGDIDLFVPDNKALNEAKKILEANGFVHIPEVSDHHLTYQYTFPKIGKTFLIELHFRVVGLYQFEPANDLVDTIYSAERLQTNLQNIEGNTYRVLPPTEYVFYLIHHMLKHYLYSGFGIRLLYDFVFFLQAHKNEIDFMQIHAWCRTSHIFHLYEVIIESCRFYLGLDPDIDAMVHAPMRDCKEFILQVLDDNDMGTITSNTLVGSSSYHQVNLFTYIKEFHLQMHVRFPKLSNYIILWPFLWIATLFCFVKNTYFLRRTTLRETLQAFKQKNESTKSLRLFENSQD